VEPLPVGYVADLPDYRKAVDVGDPEELFVRQAVGLPDRVRVL
jgi:hypothetical protein